MMKTNANEVRRLLIAGLASWFLLIGGCNEGGIVGTGEGGPNTGSSTNPVASDSTEHYRYRHLPSTLFPALPAALNGESRLQQNIRNALSSLERIQIEILYLDAALDDVEAFCRQAGSPRSCQTTIAEAGVTYDAAIVRAEHALMAGAGIDQPPLNQALTEKTGTPLPDSIVTLTRSSPGESFAARLDMQRETTDGGRIRLTIDWHQDQPAARLLYRRETTGTDGLPATQTILLFTSATRLTSRTLDQTGEQSRIFLLNVRNDERKTLIQADERIADAMGYRHIGWDGEVSGAGGFVRRQRSDDPLIGSATTLQRLLLGPTGDIEARETCQNDTGDNLCDDNSVHWISDDGTPGKQRIADSPLFVTDQALSSATFGPSPTLSLDDPQLESLIIAPAITDDGMLEAGCAATRLIAGSRFRTYCWQDAPPKGGNLFQSILGTGGLMLVQRGGNT